MEYFNRNKLLSKIRMGNEPPPHPYLTVFSFFNQAFAICSLKTLFKKIQMQSYLYRIIAIEILLPSNYYIKVEQGMSIFQKSCFS